MTRTMTERQAWLYLARRWDAATEFNNRYVASVFGLTAYGLCESVYHLAVVEKTTWAVMCSMEAKIKLVSRDKISYCWPRTKAGAKSRAAFCRKQATLLKKEGKK